MKRYIIVPLLLLVLFPLCLSAQSPEPDLEQLARQHWAFITDAKKDGNCLEASTRLKWMFDNAPEHSKNLYIKGAQIYDCLADGTEDVTMKMIYMDSALLIYDLRIKHFDQQELVMNYKVSTAYKYYIKTPGKYDELWEWFNQALKLNGAATFNGNLLGFADLIVRYHMHTEPLPLEKVMPIYHQISNIIELKLRSGEDLDNTRRIQAKIDSRMEVYFKENLQCTKLAENFGHRFDQNLDDINFAKTFFRLLRAGECKDNPYYLNTAISIFEADPSYAFAVLIGRALVEKMDYIAAEKYYRRGLDLTEDNTLIADLYLNLGKINAATGNFSKARSHFERTIIADPSSKEKAYTAIGDLYYHSADRCKQGKSKIQDRAVYFAAYEMYQRAGNQSRMVLAQAQFPLGSEIHMDTTTKGLGEKITVGCWINMEATIRKRDGANN